MMNTISYELVAIDAVEEKSYDILATVFSISAVLLLAILSFPG